MRTVDIGICHDDNFIVTELCDIEVVAVTLGKAAAECIDHGFDLGICQNFINRSLLYVQNLTADRQNCLEITVTRRLCGTARRISLDDKDLAQRRILFLAVCQFAVRIKRIFLLGQHIRLGFFFASADFGRSLSAGKNIFQHFEIAVEIQRNLLACYFSGGLCRIRVVQLRFCLALEPRIRVLDRNNSGHTVSDIRSRKVIVFFF